jgi:hypothetical protein
MQHVWEQGELYTGVVPFLVVAAYSTVWSNPQEDSTGRVTKANTDQSGI